MNEGRWCGEKQILGGERGREWEGGSGRPEVGQKLAISLEPKLPRCWNDTADTKARPKTRKARSSSDAGLEGPDFLMKC